MKDMIKNYMLNEYNIKKRSDSEGFSEEELKTYRDNFIKSLDRFWLLPPNPTSRERMFSKKLHSVCKKIIEKNQIDLVKKRIVSDNSSVLIIW